MSKPVCRSGPSAALPRPVATPRSARSCASVTRRHVIDDPSKPSTARVWAALSAIAARKLCADSMAWKSPVRWRLMSAAGSMTALPPPVPPPLRPKSGPSDGCRIVSAARFPMCARPCVRPTAVVDLPSPAGVGVMAVTTISLPRPSADGNASNGTFALSRPYGSRSSGLRPRSAATLASGRTCDSLTKTARVSTCAVARFYRRGSRSPYCREARLVTESPLAYRISSGFRSLGVAG